MFPDARLPLPGPPRVGGGPPNGFGLTDCSGVVHEWCLDYFRYRWYGSDIFDESKLKEI